MTYVLPLEGASKEDAAVVRIALDALQTPEGRAISSYDTMVHGDGWDAWLTTTSKDIHLFLGRLGEPTRQVLVRLLISEFRQRPEIKQIVLAHPARRALFVGRLPWSEKGPANSHCFTLSTGH